MAQELVRQLLLGHAQRLREGPGIPAPAVQRPAGCEDAGDAAARSLDGFGSLHRLSAVGHHPQPDSDDRNPWREFLLCIAGDAILHGLYNAFGAIGWWMAQWRVMLISLGALFVLTKFAWSEANSSNARDALLSWRELLEKHNLSAGAISLLFLAASFVLSSLYGPQTLAVTPDHSRDVLHALVRLHAGIPEAIQALSVSQLQGIQTDLQRWDLSRAGPDAVMVRDSILQTIDLVDA